MGDNNRFKLIPGADQLPVAKNEFQEEIEEKKIERTSVSVDKRISKGVDALLMIKNKTAKSKIKKEEFITNILKKELKKGLKEIDTNTLKMLGIDIDFFDL